VRDGPDVWGRVGSERRRKGRGSGLAAGKWAAVKGVGPREARWAGGERRGRLGWWAKRERGGVEGFGKFSLFLTFSNSHFKLLKLNSFQNTPRFSKHFFKSFLKLHTIK
jgi:hypothetical protein